MDKKFDLLTAGSWAIFDHLFEMERLPSEGDTVNILSPVVDVDKIYWGGCSYNAAVTAAKLGIKVGILNVEGKDFVTRGYRKYLGSFGIDLSGVTILQKERSGHGFLFADPEGNAIVLGNLGSAWSQKNYVPNSELIQSSRALIVAPTFDDFTLAACRIGKAFNVLVAVNGSLSTWPNYAERFVNTIDILFCNQFEIGKLLKLLGLKDEYALIRQGLKVLYITQGKDGSRLLTEDQEIVIPKVDAQVFVDPTGAGDAFASATVSGILLGYTFQIAGRLGSTVASFVVEKKGCQTNLPDWKMVQERYEDFFGEKLIRTGIPITQSK